jgi:RNA polymerase sigma factor (sigma-70 family)
MSVRLRLPIGLPSLVADDRSLLGQFIDERDEAAFAAIVQRHGAMVLSVCQRNVRDSHLAEDAFQAVFLVLARNPQAANRAASIGGWLFGIARRVGLAARRHELRRQKRERSVLPNASEQARDWDDLLVLVDEELERLPAEERSALIACFLRERTHDEAARELGWSVSTLRRRLDRGKELLRARLTRRGGTLSAGLFACALAPSTAVALPRTLVESAGNSAAASRLSAVLAAKAIGGIAVGKLAGATIALLVAARIAAALAGNEPASPPVGNQAAVAFASTRAPAAPREWIAVTGQVVFPKTQELPERREILKTDGFVKDAECCFLDGRRLYFENLLIDPKTRGITNAVVWLRPDKDDLQAAFPPEKLPADFTTTKSKEHIVDAIDCQFYPRITVARAGDTLRFKNSGLLITNVRYDAAEKGPRARAGGFNVLLPAKTGETRQEEPLAAGTRPDMFTSSIHSWMKGFVWAFDHPYAAITEAGGKFTIRTAPVGERICRLVIWHEEYGYGPGGARGVPVKIAAGQNGATDLGSRVIEVQHPK